MPAFRSPPAPSCERIFRFLARFVIVHFSVLLPSYSLPYHNLSTTKTFHIIGRVTASPDGKDIGVERINDCSGVVKYKGLYHVFHQCCQNHWDHLVSKDMVHWTRLPPPLAPCRDDPSYEDNGWTCQNWATATAPGYLPYSRIRCSDGFAPVNTPAPESVGMPRRAKRFDENAV